jgi:hypothetical protein
MSPPHPDHFNHHGASSVEVRQAKLFVDGLRVSVI